MVENQNTCISSKVSSSLLMLFFFSSMLSPLNRASKAVASPGGTSRFGANSASVKVGAGEKKRKTLRFGCAKCHYSVDERATADKEGCQIQHHKKKKKKIKNTTVYQEHRKEIMN